MVRPFEDIPAKGIRSFEDIPAAPLSEAPRRGVRSFEDIPVKEPPIGFVEHALERPWEKILFSPMRAIRHAEIALAGKRLTENDYTKPPIFFAAPTPGILGKFFPALTGDWTPKLQKDYDVKIVEKNILELEEKERRGYTTMGKVGGMLSEMPAFILEFITTGGLKKLGTVAAKKAGRKLLGRYATTTAGKAAIATGGFAVGTAARAAGMPHRAANAILKRQLPRDMSIAENGDVTITGPVESKFTSIWKGLADHWIEVASEEAGEYIAPVVSKYFKKLPLMGKFTSALQKQWLKINPGKAVSDFTNKILKPGGFHGVVGEVGEEYLGDITRAITDVEHFGAGEDANMLQRISAGVRQDNENLLPMLISFSIPGAIGKAADIRERKQAAQIKKKAEEVKGKYDTMITLADEAAEAGETYSFEEAEAEIARLTFDTPGLFKYATPKWLLNRLLGTEILLEDVDKATLAFGLEQKHLNTWVNKLIPRLKKEKDLARLPEVLPEEAIKEAITVKEIPDVPAMEYVETAEGTMGISNEIEIERIEDIGITKAHVLQTKIDSKKPLHIMRDLLDTYEDAPVFLTKNETKIFNEVRELTRYLRQRANIVRRKMGLKEIGDVKGYITHWLDAAATRVVDAAVKRNTTEDRNIPIHYGYLYHLMGSLPRVIKNKTAMTRKVRNEMENYFSKDLGKLLRIMTAYDLKDIYLKHPIQATWDELRELRELNLIPKETYKEIEDYLTYDILKHQAPMDKAFNRTLKKPVDLLNKLLPVSMVIHDPSRKVFSTLRRMGHVSGLGFRLRPGFRNLGQRLLLQDLYRTADYAKAQAVAFRLAEMPTVKDPLTGDDINLMDLIKRQDWYQTGLHKFEDTVGTITRAERSSLYIYGKTHIGNLFLSNVEVSALTGYFDWLNMYDQSQNTKSKHFKNCLKQSKKFGISAGSLLTQEADMMWNIREAVRRSQWEYFSISMPVFYRSQFNRAMGMFQSWWMNYFFNHCRQMINQTTTGRNSLGRLLTPGGRYRAAKGLGTIFAIGKATEGILGIELLKYLFLLRPAPGFLPPIPALIVSMIQFLGADDDKKRKRAWKEVKRNLKFWIPLSAMGRDLNKLLSGEWNIADFLFYRTERKK